MLWKSVYMQPRKFTRNSSERLFFNWFHKIKIWCPSYGLQILFSSKESDFLDKWLILGVEKDMYKKKKTNYKNSVTPEVYTVIQEALWR